MKGTRSENTRQSKQQKFSNMPRPEIRDSLDSRKNEEQYDKGPWDTTHNHKDTKAGKHKKK